MGVLERCVICNRTVPDKSYLEDHHLVPVSKGGKHSEKITVCVDCGDQVHKLFSLEELAKDYNTLERLLESDRVQKWVYWVRKQKRFRICMSRKKKR